MLRGSMFMDSKNDKIDFYSVILTFYQKSLRGHISRQNIEVWKNQMFIALMRHLKYTRKKKQIENALLLLLALFEDLPVDINHTRGKKSEQLSAVEQDQIASILKQEYS